MVQNERNKEVSQSKASKLYFDSAVEVQVGRRLGLRPCLAKLAEKDLTYGSSEHWWAPGKMH